MATKIPPKNFDNKLSRRKQDLDQIAKNEEDIAALQALPVLPTPAEGDVGKVVKAGSDGYELASDAGAKLVTATVTADGQGNLSCDKTYAELSASIANGDIVELVYTYQTFVFSGIDFAGIHFTLAKNDSNGHNVITAWTISSSNVITFLIEGMNSELPSYSSADEGKFLGVDANGHLGFFERAASYGMEIIEGTITSITDPTVTKVAANVWGPTIKSLVTAIDFENLTTLETNSFFQFTSLINVNLPKCTSVGENAFKQCSALKQISLPLASGTLDDVFDACVLLEDVSIPNITTLSGDCFRYCSKLNTLDLPKVTSINGGYTLANSKIKNLILRNSSMVTLTYSTILNSSPFAAGGAGGTIYVPQSLISTYQSNTKWAAILALNANNQILAIEGSIYE